MKILEDTINSYLDAEYKIKRLLSDTQKLMDNINVYILSSDDMQKYHTAFQAMKGLEAAYSSIVDLSKKVLLEGYLQAE